MPHQPALHEASAQDSLARQARPAVPTGLAQLGDNPAAVGCSDDVAARDVAQTRAEVELEVADAHGFDATNVVPGKCMVKAVHARLLPPSYVAAQLTSEIGLDLFPSGGVEHLRHLGLLGVGEMAERPLGDLGIELG